MRIKNLNIFPLKEQNILLENNLEVDDNGSLNLSKLFLNTISTNLWSEKHPFSGVLACHENRRAKTVNVGFGGF